MSQNETKAIAQILGKHLKNREKAPIGEYEAIEFLTLELAKFFTSENPNFNEDNFLNEVFDHCPTVPTGSYK